MDDVFKIFVEQLRDGREREIDEILDPEFLDIHEGDLDFKEPVNLKGIAYLADNELIIHWDVSTGALIRCSICNEFVSVPLEIQNFYFSESLDTVKSGIYNFKELLRETILVEVPPFIECNKGNCPKRKEYDKYLKEPSSEDEQDEGYQPFSAMDWKD